MAAPRFRPVSSRLRVNSCGVLGLVVGLLVALFCPWQLAALVGWNVATAALLAWVWLDITPCDADHTRRRATLEDGSRAASAAVVSSACVLSLAGMAAGLAKAQHSARVQEVVLTVMSVSAVVLAWGALHTMYTLRYAHLYYSDPEGGIDFHDPEPPSYHDFAYLSFTIGMAFAVSDTDITDARVRRTVLRHSILAYLFGAVIVGVTINVMAGFIR
jgi:uncharacterized membrane protein